MRAAIFSGLALVAMAGLAHAQVLASDDFSYVGALTANGWAAHSGAGNKVQMSDGSKVTLEQSGGSGEDTNLAFTPQGASDVTFAAMDMNVPSGNLVTPDSSGLYFFHLKDAGFAFRARTGVLMRQAAGDYALAINADNSNLGAGAIWPTDLLHDTTYRVVVSWDASTGTSELWLDPVDMNSPSITHTGGFTGDLMEAVALRQSNDYTGFIEVDNVVAGKSFADVTGGSGPNSGASDCDCTGGNSPCFNVSGAGRGCPNSNANGLGAMLVGSGSADTGADSFSLSVVDAAPDKPGLIFAGTSSLGPGGIAVPDSAGLLCVGGTTARGDVVFTDATGAASFPDFQGAPYGSHVLVSSGQTMSYTHWFRDPGTAAGCTGDTGAADFNFSNGWTVTWL